MSIVTVPGAVSGGTLGIADKTTISGAATSKVWQIPPRVGTLTIQVVPTNLVYTVQATANPIADVEDDSAAWFDITGTGNQSGAIQKGLFASVTAVRVDYVSGAGSAVACIRGQ